MNNQPFTPEKQAKLNKLMESVEENEQKIRELLEYGDKMIARHQRETSHLPLKSQ